MVAGKVRIQLQCRRPGFDPWVVLLYYNSNSDNSSNPDTGVACLFAEDAHVIISFCAAACEGTGQASLAAICRSESVPLLPGSYPSF